MAFYMTQWAYSADATAAMVKNPQDRSAGLKRLIEGLGGKMLAFYFCFGDYDGLVIYEMPDRVATMGAVMAATAAGHPKAIKTTELLSVDETMEAMKKAGAQIYSAPKA